MLYTISHFQCEMVTGYHSLIYAYKMGINEKRCKKVILKHSLVFLYINNT